MSTSLTPQDRERLQTLEELRGRVQRLHGLVERFGAERGDADPHVIAIRRMLSQLRLEFTGHSLDTLSQVCAGMEQTARRGVSQAQKTRILREGVGTLRLQIETAQRNIRAVAARAGANRKEGSDGASG